MKKVSLIKHVPVQTVSGVYLRRICLLDTCAFSALEVLDHYLPPHHTTAILRPFFHDHPGEPVPEENFWTLWCKGRLTEGDIPTIRMGATPSGLSSATSTIPHFLLIYECRLGRGVPPCHVAPSSIQSLGHNTPTLYRQDKQKGQQSDIIRRTVVTVA